MSPHPALQVPDILSIIFENFYREGFTDLVSLAALARSCKHFFEPAVSILWRRLWFLADLFKVIPSFALDESREVYDFHDDVEPAHWLRLESYASAVRELQVVRNQYGFDGFVMLLTARHFQGRPMLPSLVTLTLDHPKLISALPLLLSPTLRTISFCVCEDGRPINKLSYPLHKGYMRIISEQAPSIKKLVLPGFLFNRESYSPILNLRNLHTLIISTSGLQSGNVSLDIISSCASLVELKMYLGLNDATSVTLPNRKFQLPCFQSLRCLGLSASGLWINSILTMFTFIPLESILLPLNCSDVPWRTITTNVAQWANTLQSFTLTVRSELMIMPRYSDLEPLLSCHQMRQLTVGHYPFPSSPNLCHDDIVEMATAWPELRELRIHLAVVDVNLSTLILLAEKLLRLRELSLPVDLSTLPHVVTHPRRTGQRLLKLDISRFSLGESDPVTVADHLNNLFPWAAINLTYKHTGTATGPLRRLGRILNLCRRACTRAGGV